MINNDEILYSVNEQSRQWKLPANDQKPCITALLSIPIEEGFRDIAIFVVATDLLNRQCLSEDKVKNILSKWNETFPHPMTEKDIVAKIRSASKTKHNGQKITYGCSGRQQLIASNCLTKDNCPYFQKNFASTKYNNVSIYDFINSRKFKKLSGTNVKIYLSLVSLEKIKHVSPGQWLITSHRNLESRSGVCRQTISEILKTLHFEGLIEYKKGLQHRHLKTASEIRRVIPIPDTS